MRLEDRDPPHLIGSRPSQGERHDASPVVTNERELVDCDRVEKGLEVGQVIDQPVTPIGRTRGAHANEIDRDCPVTLYSDNGRNIAPQVGRGGIAVQEQHQWARADLREAHHAAERRYKSGLH